MSKDYSRRGVDGETLGFLGVDFEICMVEDGRWCRKSVNGTMWCQGSFNFWNLEGAWSRAHLLTPTCQITLLETTIRPQGWQLQARPLTDKLIRGLRLYRRLCCRDPPHNNHFLPLILHHRVLRQSIDPFNILCFLLLTTQGTMTVAMVGLITRPNPRVLIVLCNRGSFYLWQRVSATRDSQLYWKEIMFDRRTTGSVLARVSFEHSPVVL